MWIKIESQKGVSTFLYTLNTPIVAQVHFVLISVRDETQSGIGMTWRRDQNFDS
jgi:hypothetical protein